MTRTTRPEIGDSSGIGEDYASVLGQLVGCRPMISKNLRLKAYSADQ